MSRPFMPWYAGDYDRKTQHLSLAEHGAYRRLIDTYWTNGGPIFQRNIPTILGVSRTIFERKYFAKISTFFYIIDGEWFHSRVEKELQRIDDKSRLSQKAHNVRYGRAPASAPAEAPAERLPRARVLPEPEPLREERKDIKAPSAPKISPEIESRKILETCLSSETAGDLIAHRKAKKSPLTPGAAKGLVKVFCAWAGGAEEAAQAMMARGWTGFKPQWMREDIPPPHRGGGAAQRRDNGRGGAQSLLAEIYRNQRDENDRGAQEKGNSGDVLQLPVVHPESGANGDLNELISASFNRV